MRRLNESKQFVNHKGVYWNLSSNYWWGMRSPSLSQHNFSLEQHSSHEQSVKTKVWTFGDCALNSLVKWMHVIKNSFCSTLSCKFFWSFWFQTLNTPVTQCSEFLPQVFEHLSTLFFQRSSFWCFSLWREPLLLILVILGFTSVWFISSAVVCICLVGLHLCTLPGDAKPAVTDF